MKRIVSLVLLLTLCLSLCACGNSKKAAFTAPKEAYQNVREAYEIVENYGSYLYTAWQKGIYDKDEILKQGSKYLADELSITEDELKDGVAYWYLCELDNNDWSTLSDDEKDKAREMTDSMFKYYKDDLFSVCVQMVTAAYKANGEVSKVQASLDAAKAQMKELSEKYSEYEHYPNLKGYYTTTSSFFDFCQNPSGSFEQVKTTINDYKNSARDYSSDLDYIFED